MKWTLAELKELDKPILIDSVLDFSEEIKDLSDVKAISPVHVKGTGFPMEDDEYVFSLDISSELTMECAITLKDVKYPLNFHTDEVFAKTNEDKEDINLISNGEIDLVPVIYSCIVINKPMRVVSDGATFESPKKEEYINPAFAGLKEYLNKK